MRSHQPNIFLIVADSLRADHLSCYGYHRHTTPRLDAIARTGTLYAAAISPAAWAPASHASLLTGLPPSRHGVTRLRPELDPSVPTLPETLRELGYRTFGLSSSYWVSAATGFHRGFDVFLQSWQRCQTETNLPLERQRRRDPGYRPGHSARPAPERLRTRVNQAEAAFRRYSRSVLALDKGARRANRTVRQWARTWAGSARPVFAFINYIEAHLPYAAPPPYRDRHLGDRKPQQARGVNQRPFKLLRGQTNMAPEDFEILGRLYDGEVTYTDHRLGELVDTLDATGLLDDAVVAITSGHGENLGDHGLMDHMFSVHDSIVRVPLVVRYPRGHSRGVQTGLVQTHDLFPTLLALAGGKTVGHNGHAAASSADTPAGAVTSDGTLLPPFGQARDFAVTEVMQVRPSQQHRTPAPGFDAGLYERTLRGLRTTTHKYIRDSSGAETLYCLVADPGETTDRARVEPDETARLREWLDRWEGACAAPVHQATAGMESAGARPQELV